MLEAEFIRVTARVRPSASRIPQERLLEIVDEKNLCFDPRNERKNFAFDAVFGEDVNQEQIYDEVASRIIDGCIDGVSGTILAYGQTGSGKTHTMLGPRHVENPIINPAQRGLIPRACEALFQKLCNHVAEKGENFEYEVSCKFVELYNEYAYDLIGNSRKRLAIRSDSTMVQILGVSEHSVHSSTDMLRLLEVGCARQTEERSHAVFIIEVKIEELRNATAKKRTAILNLVDLAGSERQSQAEKVGIQLREATEIKLSITHLGRVVRALANDDTHVPYRDSKLTQILRESFGGNSRTAVIVTLHPDKDLSMHFSVLSTASFQYAVIEDEDCNIDHVKYNNQTVFEMLKGTSARFSCNNAFCAKEKLAEVYPDLDKPNYRICPPHLRTFYTVKETLLASERSNDAKNLKKTMLSVVRSGMDVVGCFIEYHFYDTVACVFSTT